ncbi:SMI1/KNR4 family protein [Nonomuraea sp. NPDC050310]|uniref:SMI1/KNR4 family protein n=1 Tax=Nonomuraea sp. NPDC050310 TaxID=3154935 RepID=UPI0033CF492B
MDRATWSSFLHRWNEDCLACPDYADIIPDGWAGFPPATEEQVTVVEGRLGVRLPPSLREFLLFSNGWGHTMNFVEGIRSAEELGWVRDLDPMWCEHLEGAEEEAAIFQRGLLICTEADAGCLFLDPGDVDERGEWAAYEVFSWMAEAPRRHDSFYDLMYSMFAAFHHLERPQCATQREWDSKVEQARRAALAGALDEAEPVLREAAAFGRDRARVLLFQIDALVGGQDTGLVVSALSRGGRPAGTWELDGSLVAAEILPVLHLEHLRTNHHLQSSTFSHLRKYGTEPIKQLVGDYLAKAGEAGFRVVVGNAEFDAAVQAAIADPDTAWPRIREALALWRPLSEDHIAPASLMADPRLAGLITPERGREILMTRRG